MRHDCKQVVLQKKTQRGSVPPGAGQVDRGRLREAVPQEDITTLGGKKKPHTVEPAVEANSNGRRNPPSRRP